MRSDDAGDETVEALLRVLGARDAGLLAHSWRVARLTEVVAEWIGVPTHEIPQVQRGGLLHDVGKIGVPDRLLLKPARLTTDETRVMQDHVVIGHGLIAPIRRLQVPAEIVLYHHERFDGSGYPCGLKGDAIPFGARLVAIADVFDALSHPRPYRKALPFDTAIAEIRHASGTRYDPGLARAFLELADRGKLPTPQPDLS